MQVNGADVRKQELNEMFNKIVSSANSEAAEQTVEQAYEVMSKSKIKECNHVSNIPDRYKYSRFSDFEYGEIGNDVKKFSLNPNSNAFLLYGPTGVGKTSLICSALHERAVNDLSAGLYFNNRFLMPTLRTCRSFSAKENEESFVRRLSRVPFLCIDEVGASSNLKEEGEFLSLLICARYDNNLPTFIATNLDTLNFSLLLAGVDLNETPDCKKKELCLRLKKSNATLDRFNSIAIKRYLPGDSYRIKTEN